MPIQYHPRPGEILMCDFSSGFKEPEMVKKRPVLVIGPNNRPNLCTIFCLSSVEPNPLQKYHYKLPPKTLPNTSNFHGKETWVKADMVYTVGFHRLEKIRLSRNGDGGKRGYFNDRLARETMKEIYACLLHSLNLGHVVQHI